MRTDHVRVLAFASIAVLGAMVAITFTTGVSQETFEIARSPDVYADELRLFATPLRALFALDSMFLVLYAVLLVQFALRVRTGETRVLAAIAIGAVVLTAALDMIEDHSILAMLRLAERNIEPSASAIAMQHVISQVKFHVGYLGLFVLGLAVPRTSRAAVVLVWLLTAGTLVQGAWLYAAPDSALPAGNVGRWVGFLVGFALIAKLSPAGGAATGARA
jgi:hypothetical protein